MHHTESIFLVIIWISWTLINTSIGAIISNLTVLITSILTSFRIIRSICINAIANTAMGDSIRIERQCASRLTEGTFCEGIFWALNHTNILCAICITVVGFWTIINTKMPWTVVKSPMSAILLAGS